VLREVPEGLVGKIKETLCRFFVQSHEIFEFFRRDIFDYSCSVTQMELSIIIQVFHKNIASHHFSQKER
jgi:hypothetical protein